MHVEDSGIYNRKSISYRVKQIVRDSAVILHYADYRTSISLHKNSRNHILYSSHTWTHRNSRVLCDSVS